MSRLDSAIRRLKSQKICLDFASSELSNISGVIVEIGLGNGRTYDHLRELFPKRKIYVFERDVNAHPDCIPPDDFLFKGDFNKTLIGLKDKIVEPIILIHFDIGSGYNSESNERASSLSFLLKDIIDRKGLIIGDQSLDKSHFLEISTPKGVDYAKYFIYKLI
ncbi:MAG: hypothetical protein CFH01_00437 [Alphaproteobacteria bacterium MarineAlpha2_Bin1]|nr:MAG: hypothetical protein CFH01_00437 [Alphaproteobacteria bacterium MarineAlpha2_Bin1]|tara:strand:+ start:745 stop:1233 length:489 start_codon:yes stop_codon:yes gene_type:complete